MAEKTFTQEELDAIIEERLKRERKQFDKEKKALERQRDESIEEYEKRIEEANLTAEEKYKKELEKIAKEKDELGAQLSKIKTDEVKRATLKKYKLSEKFLARVSGSTAEEIEASVKDFSDAIGEYVKSQVGAGAPAALQGGSKEGGAKADLEALKKKAMESGSYEDRAAYNEAKREAEAAEGASE